MFGYIVGKNSQHKFFKRKEFDINMKGLEHLTTFSIKAHQSVIEHQHQKGDLLMQRGYEPLIGLGLIAGTIGTTYIVSKIYQKFSGKKKINPKEKSKKSIFYLHRD